MTVSMKLDVGCCLAAVCGLGLGLGPSSPIIHGTRWVVPSLEHCQWSQQHTNTDSSIHQQQSRHNSQHSAMCSVSISQHVCL